MQQPDDAQLLQGLKDREETAYRLLYQFYYPVIEKFVLRNSGTKADAGDLFQDAMVVLWRQVSGDGFTLRASLKTYLFAISRNLWFKRLRQAKRRLGVRLESLPEADPAFACWEHRLEEEKEKEKTLSQTLSLWLERITTHCRTLLQNLFLRGGSVEELGYKNKHTAQNQQYKCLQQLRRSAAGQPAKNQ